MLEIDGPSHNVTVRNQALQLAWDNGVFLKREFVLQRGVLEYLVRAELDKRQEPAMLDAPQENTKHRKPSK